MAEVRTSYDVVIVGASVAGCISAIEFARRGVRVAVIEKNTSPDKYKVVCSHILHANVVEELRSLGVYEELLERGGQATGLEIHVSDTQALAYPLSKKPVFANIQRRILDPVVKGLLERFDGIETHWGQTVKELVRDDRGRVVAVRARSRKGEITRFAGSLVVAADGVRSPLARMDDCRETTLDNGRVGIFRHFESPVRSVPTRIWALNRGESYIGYIPNGDRVMLNGYIPRSLYDEAKGNMPEFFEEFVVKPLLAKGLAVGQPLTELFVAKKTSTSYRTGTSAGMVLVGDARISADVMTGVGCSWAVVSSKMLVGTMTGAILAARQDTLLARRRLQLMTAAYKIGCVLRFNASARLIALASTNARSFLNPTFLKVALGLVKRIYPDNASVNLPRASRVDVEPAGR